jgi:hypothetical protein
MEEANPDIGQTGLTWAWKNEENQKVAFINV